MINAVLVMNTQGKPRLTKFYEPLDTKLVYKHFATLYFVFVIDKAESELGILDLIQVFVEILDKNFKNVCELDIVYNFNKVHTILDEIVMGGQVVETNSAEIMKAVQDINTLEKAGEPIPKIVKNTIRRHVFERVLSPVEVSTGYVIKHELVNGPGRIYCAETWSNWHFHHGEYENHVSAFQQLTNWSHVQESHNFL